LDAGSGGATGDLHFYVNGVDQGVAATGVPLWCHAVLDMYGKCVEISAISGTLSPSIASTHTVIDRALVTSSGRAPLVMSRHQLSNEEQDSDEDSGSELLPHEDVFCFHERHGSLIKLTNKRKTAERRHPMDEFNNGVVMTNRPVKDNEMFEIRIDCLVNKWSGSIEMGVTTHDPSEIDFPATMTNLRSGTIMMSGCGILTNGKGSRREYGHYNLDELNEGSRIGVMRKSCGTLHYFINGVDQGVAASRVPSRLWGVVDLYGMTVKVTMLYSPILRDTFPSYNDQMISNRNDDASTEMELNLENAGSAGLEGEPLPVPLAFHQRCGSRAAVIGPDMRTAHRPHAMEDFNNGVVLSNRILLPDEMFEVNLDKLVDKWAGSIELGVTTNTPSELEFPSTMTNVRSGTWMMTGNGVMHNGTTVIDDFGQNLDRLKENDRVGVVRKRDGTLHFFVNGIDQGQAAFNVPANVYGVIDLYGQAAQATLIEHPVGAPSLEGLTDPFRFHARHGANARITNNGFTATRPHARGEFNDAIVISHRPLRDDEIFEVEIERMVDRWSGSIELGVTTIGPEEIAFPNTMTDIDYDTWMLSGAAVMQDGATIKNGYALDLDSLSVNSRVGMSRNSGDGALHFWLNGTDMGPACYDVSPNIYAVIDLYGQCSQVSIIHPESLHSRLMSEGHRGAGVLGLNGWRGSKMEAPASNDAVVADNNGAAIFHSAQEQMASTHRFHPVCGKQVAISDHVTASRVPNSFSHGLVFSAEPLQNEEVFEVRVQKIHPHFAGSIRIGLTNLNVNGTHFLASNVANSVEGLATMKPSVAMIDGNVVKDGTVIKENYASSLDRVGVNTRVGVKRCEDATMHVLINGEDVGVAATDVPRDVFAVVDVYGRVESVGITSSVPTSVSAALLTRKEKNQSRARNMQLLQSSRDRIAEPPEIVVASSEAVAAAAAAAAAAPAEEDEAASPLGAMAPPIAELVSDKVDDDVSSETATINQAQVDSPVGFHHNHGKNVRLTGECRDRAERTASYNQGLVVSSAPLKPDVPFCVRVDSINYRWTSGLAIGVIAFSPERLALPLTSMGLKRGSWVFRHSHLFHDGVKVGVAAAPDKMGGALPHLNALAPGHTVGVLIDDKSALHLLVDGEDQGAVAFDLPPCCYAIVDLYGLCDAVSFVEDPTPTPEAPNQASNRQETANNSNECREKGDMEEGMKEKQFKSPPSSPLLLSSSRLNQTTSASNRNCEILSTAKRFIASMGLPTGFFRFDQSECFCDGCLRVRGEVLSSSRCRHAGEPPKAFALPVGWCFVALQQLRSRGRSPDYQDKWHTAYHALTFDRLRQTLDSGSLEDPGEFLTPSTEVSWCLAGGIPDSRKKENAQGEQLKTQVLLTPSIKLIQTNPLTAFADFQDKKSGRRYRVRVAVQVLAKPGSYVTSAASTTAAAAASPAVSSSSSLSSPYVTNSTAASSSSLRAPSGLANVGAELDVVESGLSNNELEWRTKEHGGLLLKGLLIKLEHC